MRLIVGILGVVLALAVTTLVVNAATIMGTVGSGSNGNGYEQAFADSWNDSSEFSCTNNSPFTVTASNGPCAGQSVMIVYDVNTGGVSNNSHNFTYQVNCMDNEVRHFVGFDGADLGSINKGTFVFNLSGGDTLTAETAAGASSVPTLSEWGMIALVAVLLASGIFVILRRNRLSPETS